jgi:hypothetical protein
MPIKEAYVTPSTTSLRDIDAALAATLPTPTQELDWFNQL